MNKVKILRGSHNFHKSRFFNKSQNTSKFQMGFPNARFFAFAVVAFHVVRDFAAKLPSQQWS